MKPQSNAPAPPPYHLLRKERLEAIASRSCTCHLLPPDTGCGPCWAQEKLERGEHAR